MASIEPREEIVTVGSTKVHTLIGGRGDPLVVLHGAGGNRGWRRWMATLADRYTIYAPTHPGFGASDGAEWMEDIGDLAGFYLWFLDTVGLERPHLLGHSIGGWTAAEMAVIAPRAIERLILVAPAGLKPEHGEILDIFYHTPADVSRMGVHDPATIPEWDELFGRPPTPEQAELAVRNREMAARITWRPYMYNPRLAHFLPRAVMPTLVVWGREDRIVPVVCGEQYCRFLPNASLLVLGQCGHQPGLEQPDTFASLVDQFLSASSADTSKGVTAR